MRGGPGRPFPFSEALRRLVRRPGLAYHDTEMGIAGSGMAKLLPAEVRGWKAAVPDGLYDAETLYDYIDGGAEVYRELNVKRVFARRYVKDGAPGILANLFDMGSSSDAFGAYHHDLREGEQAGVGRESELTEASVAFWKGSFFISLIALDEVEAARVALVELARSIDKAINDEGGPPALVTHRLPGGVSSELRYFHTELSLKIYTSAFEAGVLGLGRDTEVLLGRLAGRAGTVLVVRYPTADAAARALNRIPGIDGFTSRSCPWSVAPRCTRSRGRRRASPRRDNPVGDDRVKKG